MKIVPVIKSSDLQRSLHFYTEVLDFERKWPGYEDREMENGVIDLVRDGAELQLSRHAGDGVFGSVIASLSTMSMSATPPFASAVSTPPSAPTPPFTPPESTRRGDSVNLR